MFSHWSKFSSCSMVPVFNDLTPAGYTCHKGCFRALPVRILQQLFNSPTHREAHYTKYHTASAPHYTEYHTDSTAHYTDFRSARPKNRPLLCAWWASHLSKAERFKTNFPEFEVSTSLPAKGQSSCEIFLPLNQYG